MCGIAGFSGAFPRELLSKINDAQAHRGPDGSGIYLDESHSVGLAHVRLAIIDLSDAGLQPMYSADGRYVISYNGEIYNFGELKAGLISRGHVFNSHTDTEVLLAMFAEQGPSMLPKLNGIFAFAIYDSVTGELFLARDAYGVKPLYYAETEDGFLFASELRSLLCHDGVRRDVDLDALSQLMTFLWVPAPRTLLAQVRKIEPGGAMIVANKLVARSWRYATHAGAGLQPATSAPAVEIALREQLESAVTRQLVSDVPVAAFLSGGLDSSAVVAFAQRNYSGDGGVRCFTLGEEKTDRGFVADLPYAKTAAKHLGVSLAQVRADDALADDVPGFLAQQDEPIPDPAALNVWRICREAHLQGFKVMLSGVGGDDLFSGYRRHLALMGERYWAWAPAAVRRNISRAVGLLPKSRPLGRRIHKALQFAHLEGDRRLISYFYWLPPDRVQRLTNRKCDVDLPLRQALAELPDHTTSLEKMLHLERQFFLADHNLAYTDKAAMRWSVEVRVPFLDVDLVRWAATVPAWMKVRHRHAKWIFKRAMRGILPKQVIWRPKAGFGAPLGQWLRGPLSGWLAAELESSEAAALFDAQELRQMHSEMSAGGDEVTYALFAVAAVTSWIRSVNAGESIARRDGCH